MDQKGGGDDVGGGVSESDASWWALLAELGRGSSTCSTSPGFVVV